MANFVALRVAAALVIIYGNDWMLSDLPGPGFWGVPMAYIGYDLLFCVSGYLLTASWDRDPVLARFLANRLGRVLPALFVSVLATAFVLGPLVTTLRLRQYLSSHATYRYLENAALYRHLWLPGAFAGQPSAGEVNPVLWSLLAGALCCGFLPILASLRWKLRVAALGIAAVGCGTASLYLQHGADGAPAMFLQVSVPDLLGVAPFFALGALLRTIERRWPEIYRADLAMLCFAANWIVASWYGWWNVPVTWITLPYMAICFGRLSMPPSRWLAGRADLSFGLFLYAFPMQQTMRALLPSGSPYIVPAALALTFAVAFLSLRIVEQPAMAWKHWLAVWLRAETRKAVP